MASDGTGSGWNAASNLQQQLHRPRSISSRIPPSMLRAVQKATTETRVTPASLGSVLASPAYMCFYVTRHIDYKPCTTPSYVVTRETEAVREKEMEREKELARIKEFEEALLATV
ncbi:hypothetical protein B0H14DRAFT_3449411 [Mycena olivaceomarginata]|nr:hypothetical protein B0H14DRAFT_3449411 [Mycena olivaceomarginata]